MSSSESPSAAPPASEPVGPAADRKIRVLMLPAKSSNPYLRLLIEGLGPRYHVTHMQARTLGQDADILHVHWPENLFRIGSLRNAAWTGIIAWNLNRTIARIRRNGGALVWTAHNAERHDPVAPVLGRFYAAQMRAFFRSVDMAIAMSAEQLPLLRRQYPDIAADRWRVAEHPHYRDAYAAFRPREETRNRLGIPASATLVVMLGLMRRYKGIEEAIGVFRAAARPDEFLLLAGHCGNAALRRRLEQAVAGVPNIRLLLGHVADIDIASYFRAADLALYNFTRILNSGSVLAALSLDCPVMAPRATVFEEQKRRNPAWLDLFDPPLTPQRLRSGLDQAALGRPAGSPNLDAQSVEAVGAAHRRIYEETLALTSTRVR